MAYYGCVKIEWDKAKDESNVQKHGLSFNEAKELFLSGDDYLEIYDLEHSNSEDRFIAIGRIVRGVAVVVYTERLDERLRIISARFATKREQQMYRDHLGTKL